MGFRKILKFSCSNDLTFSEKSLWGVHSTLEYPLLFQWSKLNIRLIDLFWKNARVFLCFFVSLNQESESRWTECFDVFLTFQHWSWSFLVIWPLFRCDANGKGDDALSKLMVWTMTVVSPQSGETRLIHGHQCTAINMNLDWFRPWRTVSPVLAYVFQASLELFASCWPFAGLRPIKKIWTLRFSALRPVQISR